MYKYSGNIFVIYRPHPQVLQPLPLLYSLVVYTVCITLLLQLVFLLVGIEAGCYHLLPAAIAVVMSVNSSVWIMDSLCLLKEIMSVSYHHNSKEYVLVLVTVWNNYIAVVTVVIQNT